MEAPGDLRDADVFDVIADAVDGDVEVDATDAKDAQSDVAPGEPAIAPVVVGLYATPALAVGASGVLVDGAEDGEMRMEAVLTSLAAGARGLVVEVEWEQLLSEEGWEPLTRLATFLARERKQLLLSIPVVEARADRRPEALRSVAWSSVVIRARIHDLIDQVFGRLGPDVTYLSLGMEVDLFIDAKPSVASEFATAMAEGIAYACTHPKRTTKTLVGVTWSTKAWQAQLGVERSLLTGVSDVVLLAHHGMEGTQQAQTVDAAVVQIREAIEAIEAFGGKPAVLHRVAGSSKGVGTTAADQAELVKQVFAVVQEKRARVPFVGVAALHDPSPESCQAFAQARVPSTSSDASGLYAFWCSVGLRDAHGVPKDSFGAFLHGAATFLSP